MRYNQTLYLVPDDIRIILSADGRGDATIMP
jgi:hypothetical protein